MHEAIESRLRGLARRAGWAGAPPAVVAAALGLACVAVAVALWRWWPAGDAGSVAASAPTREVAAPASQPRPAPRTASGSKSTEGAETPSAATTMCVHVVGAVVQPGVYVLAVGTRVSDAIQVAGGVSKDAAPDAINLAAKVEDGQQVLVPTKAQVAKGDVPATAGSGTTAGPANTGAGASAGGPGAAGAAKVDLNTADGAQFDTLPGVGPSTAAKIVADREANGRFKSVDDLGRVTGIGPKKLDALRDLVVVR